MSINQHAVCPLYYGQTDTHVCDVYVTTWLYSELEIHEYDH